MIEVVLIEFMMFQYWKRAEIPGRAPRPSFQIYFINSGLWIGSSTNWMKTDIAIYSYRYSIIILYTY